MTRVAGSGSVGRAVDRDDVVDKALEVLAKVGLPDLTMRRLGNELGVRQSALYHHFANKQALLGAVADEILIRGPRSKPGAAWDGRVRARCLDLRAAVLAYPDGADVVSSMFAFGLGGAAPHEELVEELAAAGLPESLVRTSAHTLLHYVYGHAVAQQAREHALRLGAIDPGDEGGVADDFEVGLGLVVDGIRLHVP